MTATLVSINGGVRTVAPWVSAAGHSGIDKRPAAHRVLVTPDGVAGDVVADRRHHGDADKAVYAYAGEPAHGVTIGEVFRASTDPSLLPRLLMAAELPDKVRAKAARRLAGTR